MTSNWPELVRGVFSEETAFTVGVAVLVIGFILAYAVWRWTHALFNRTGLQDAVEGTTFDRWAQQLGTSTAGLIGQILALFVYISAIIFAFHVAQLLDVEHFWPRLAGYMPRLFIAIIAIIVGIIVGEKAQLVIQERLRSVKLPEAAIIPELVKYSIFYIAGLIALGQVGVATSGLLILLAAYAFGLVFLGGIAFKDLLSASAAGLYLLLVEPYSIGDEVRIDERRGIVQEIDMFVTHIEANGEEHIIPNQRIFKTGIIKIRE